MLATDQSHLGQSLERTSRVTADLLVQQHCSTISSLQEQIRTLTNDRDERERKAGSQIQVLLSARAEQGTVNVLLFDALSDDLASLQRILMGRLQPRSSFWPKPMM